MMYMGNDVLNRRTYSCKGLCGRTLTGACFQDDKNWVGEVTLTCDGQLRVPGSLPECGRCLSAAAEDMAKKKEVVNEFHTRNRNKRSRQN